MKSIIPFCLFSLATADDRLPDTVYKVTNLVNARYEGNDEYHPSFLQAAAAIDGKFDWDNDFHTSGNWNPSATPYDYFGATRALNMGDGLFVDMETPSDVKYVKVYPRRDAGGGWALAPDYTDYNRMYILIANELDERRDCLPVSDRSENNIPNLYDIGILFECPYGSSLANQKTIRVYPGGNKHMGLIELEVFSALTVQTVFQPENLMLRNYALELMEAFVSQSTVIPDNYKSSSVYEVTTHGCWCAKLSKTNPYLEFLGGPDPVDELDEICKNWFKCRNCNDRLRGGSCNVAGSSSSEMLRSRSYTIQAMQTKFNTTAECDPNETDQCVNDDCSIDLRFARDIYDYLEENYSVLTPLVVSDNSTCSAAINTNKTRICSGTAPYLTPVVNDVQRYIAEGWHYPYNTPENCQPNDPAVAGVDVVYKVFALSKTWYEARDHCQSLGEGVTLARITCHNEMTFTRSLVTGLGSGYVAWSGGNDVSNEGTWVWAEADGSNGPEIERSWDINWAGGQPDNASGTEDCLEINRFGMEFNDNQCYVTLNSFVCEKRFY